MVRRGFTLLELLIVLGVLLALIALVFPALGSRVAGARFDAGKRQVEAALVMARAEAQRQGRAMALRSCPAAQDAGLCVEPFDAVIPEGEAGATGEQKADTPQPWVVLPRGVRVTDRVPQSGASSGAAAEDRPESADDLWGAAAKSKRPLVSPGSASVVIAVFQADGSAWAPGGSYLVQENVGEGPRVVEIRVNRWTGSAAMHEVNLNAPDATESPPAGREAAAARTASRSKGSKP
jgi:prepilin-type N-terminal cleavage/methylation domain-containing protein